MLGPVLDTGHKEMSKIVSVFQRPQTYVYRSSMSNSKANTGQIVLGIDNYTIMRWAMIHRRV